MKKGKQMSKLHFLQTIYLQNKSFYFDKNCQFPLDSHDAVSIGRVFSDCYADALLVIELSNTDDERVEAISCLKNLVNNCEIPVYISGRISNFEDIKKYLYTGVEKLVYSFDKIEELSIIKEGISRFGENSFLLATSNIEELGKLNHREDLSSIKLLLILNDKKPESFTSIFDYKFSNELYGLAIELKEIINFLELKDEMGNENRKYEINSFKPSISWCNFKLNSEGLIPVIVQDYKSNEVLMLAYMNEEAFQITLKTGKMTFYSRSRQEIWTKGLTSGHYQYLKSLTLDCDSDTILAKVSQVGVACHTGEFSCFYKELVKKEYKDIDSKKIFEDLYRVIKERKMNPKEGSYTNYLFDKGIDKILKKVGEEATEIIIAAKNPDSEEIIYEVSDFLYHVMVLMVEKGVSWEDILRELANRQ